MKVESDRSWARLPARQSAYVIVCERTGIWALALRRELNDLASRLVETRNLSDCRQQVVAAPASIVALEFVAANSDATLDFLQCLTRDFRQARTIVLAGPERWSWQWLAREMGAVHVAPSPRHMAGVAEIVRRHLAAFPSEPDLAERILAELNWGE